MRRLPVCWIRGMALPCALIAIALFVFSAPSFGTNLLINGGFESGNVGFSSDYTYSYNMDAYGEGKYYVGSNPHDHNPQFYNMGAEEGVLMMIVNGALQPDVTVWRESGISVQPQTTYGFSAWIAEVSGIGTLARVSVSINGVSLGTMTPTPDGTWRGFQFAWESGSSTSADVILVDQNTSWEGNDFALDNMKLEVGLPTATMKSTWGKIKDVYR